MSMCATVNLEFMYMEYAGKRETPDLYGAPRFYNILGGDITRQAAAKKKQPNKKCNETNEDGEKNC